MKTFFLFFLRTRETYFIELRSVHARKCERENMDFGEDHCCCCWLSVMDVTDCRMRK